MYMYITGAYEPLKAPLVARMLLITKYGFEIGYVAMDLIPILLILGSLPLAHNAQHSLVLIISRIGLRYAVRAQIIILLWARIQQHYSYLGPGYWERLMTVWVQPHLLAYTTYYLLSAPQGHFFGFLATL